MNSPQQFASKVAVWAVFAQLACSTLLNAAPLRIMPLGDSITCGYTDNPNWNVPFEFGYRGPLYTLLKNAGYEFQFVGACPQPFDNYSGDPTRGGTVAPTLDLRPLGQNGHRGYGGVSIATTNTNVPTYLTSDNPDIILLMIGINGIGTGSPVQLDTLVNTIVTNKPTAQLIVAQITPKATYNADLFNYNTYIRNTLVPKYVNLGKKVSTVDQYTHFLTNPADPTTINPALLSNGINHPTNPIYQMMATTWFAGIQKLVMVDTDNDQLSDAWETAKAGNLNELTAQGDFDHGGLNDHAEYVFSTGSYPNINPTSNDSDGDGLPDGEEIAGAGQRPPTDPTLTDTDADQIGDICETHTGVYLNPLNTGTNPVAADSDGDGTPDGAEVVEGSNPLAAASPTAAILTRASSSAELNFSADASASDLLHGLSGGNAIHSGWNLGNNASPTRLNDGAHGGTFTTNNVEGAWANATGSVSTFTLPPGGGNGWDLTRITSFAAWINAGFGNQNYLVSVRRIGETGFSPLASVNYQPFSITEGGSSKVVITRTGGKLASGAIAVQFSMRTTTGNAGRTVYREIDVAGSPTLSQSPEILELLDSREATGDFKLSWSSRPAKTYRIETSPNLVDWALVSAIYPSGGISTTCRHPIVQPTPAKAFYRVSENP